MDLIADITRCLEGMPQVKLAVLYGSRARGTEIEASDIDVVVEASDESWRSREGLEQELSRATGGLTAQVDWLAEVTRDPVIHDQVLRDGIALVDRSDQWPRLLSEAESVREAAQRRWNVIDARVARLLDQAG